jgi:hypothetical protein
MSLSGNSVLQIVPVLPGTFDGVGDYALNLAKALSADHGITTTFAVARKTSATVRDGYAVVSGLDRDAAAELGKKCDHVLLHYVNYGYQARGVPFFLPTFLRGLRQSCRGRLLTVFHELYASGPPWKSAFWLRPLQKKIARDIAHLSDAAIVSNETNEAELRKLVSGLSVCVLPVCSNFGEPSLSAAQLADRDPRRWAICGGTALVARSLQSFRAVQSRIPDSVSPEKLFVLGGSENPAVRAMLSGLPDLQTEYLPAIDRAEASRILSTCSFAWLDYFHRPDVPTTAILKSTAFAAACAHGVIALFPHPGSAISLREDPLPGPYFVAADRMELPDDRARVAAEVYAWYHRNASSGRLASGIAQMLLA